MRVMARRTPHFSRPVYEGLPWFYIICGLLALGGSYLLAAHGFVSLLVGAAGLLSVLAGAVVLLRRREYRALRSQYADPDAFGDHEDL
jgi:membrane associated rhomboid family serine protease